MPYCIRVLSQQAWGSVSDSVQYLVCQYEVMLLLQCVHLSSGWAMRYGNRAWSQQIDNMRHETWCYLARYLKVAFWSENNSAGYYVQKHIHWKLLDSQMLTYCYRDLFLLCLDLFKLHILQDGESLQAHLSACSASAGVCLWAHSIISPYRWEEWVYLGDHELRMVSLHSNTVSSTRFSRATTCVVCDFFFFLEMVKWLIRKPFPCWNGGRLSAHRTAHLRWVQWVWKGWIPN